MPATVDVSMPAAREIIVKQRLSWLPECHYPVKKICP